MGTPTLQEHFEGVPAIGAHEFVDLGWQHKQTTVSSIGEPLAYSGSTQWEAVWGDSTLRLQWDWMFEPYFQRPFTMDMQPRSNALFAQGDFVDHALPVSPRVKTLRSAIDKLDWCPTVLEELYKQDADLKARVETLLRGLC